MKNEGSERDFLVYREDKPAVPLFLKIAWALLLLFGAVYLTKFAWPDLRSWWGR